MKKITSLVLALGLLAGMLAGCGSASTTSTVSIASETVGSSAPVESAQEESSAAAESSSSPAASGTHEIVIFGSMLEDMLGIDVEEFYNDVVQNTEVEDAWIEGSDVYLVVSEEMHRELLDGIRAAIDISINDIITSEEITSIKAIEYNSDVSVFDITVDRVAFDSGWDALATIVLTVSGAMYQMYDGVDEVNITLNLIDEATGEVYDTSYYPS